MRRARFLPLMVLTIFCLADGPATQPASLAPDNFDFKAMLGDPPADGSDLQKGEIEKLLELQAQRTPEEVERCKAEVEGTAFEMAAPALGTSFDAKAFPLLSALMKDVTKQTKVVSNAAKANWVRKRPYLLDDRVKPCVDLEKSFSYPSGHATRGIVWATLLGEIFPEHREALMTLGRQFGTDRSLAGVHYPSDVVAAQKLGAEIAKRMLADPEFHARLDKAKEEVTTAAAHP